MCHPVKCRVCGNTTWAGCGQHVSSVKRMVPAGQWCNGKHTQAEIAEAQANHKGFFARMFGR